MTRPIKGRRDDRSIYAFLDLNRRTTLLGRIAEPPALTRSTPIR